MAVPLIITPTSPLLASQDAVILDASWLYKPDPPTRNAHEEFLAGPRFPNARFWDLEAVSEPHPDGYVLMLPSPERFASFAGKHGIKKDSHVIVYDGEGVFAAPRTAWTFKVGPIYMKNRDDALIRHLYGTGVRARKGVRDRRWTASGEKGKHHSRDRIAEGIQSMQVCAHLMLG